MNVSYSDTFDRATELQNSGDLDGARQLYTGILRKQPDHIPTLMNLGAICYTLHEYQLALGLYGVVLRVEPRSPDALFNRGCVYQAENELALAEQDYRASLSIQSDSIRCVENLISVLLLQATDPDFCIALIEQRLNQSRDSSYLLILGQLQAEAGRVIETARCYDEILALSPADAAAHYHQGVQALKNGDTQAALPGMQRRWDIPDFLATNPPRVIPIRKWHGEPLKEKSLFVSTEQGVGDVVMFAHCLPSLMGEAGGMQLECDPRLVRIFDRSFPRASVVAATTTALELPHVEWSGMDYYCLLGDLPGAYDDLRNTRGPWLRSDPRLRHHWQDWLSAYSGLKVGVCWTTGRNDNRALPLEDLAAALSDRETTLISLQYDADADEILAANAALHQPVLIPPDLDARNDLDSLFSLIDELDLIVTIDNCTAYFAASLGKPVWVLLPPTNVNDWRWQVARQIPDDNEHIGTFRSADRNVWHDALQNVAQELVTFDPPDNSPATVQEPADESHTTPYRLRTKKILLTNDSMNWAHWGHSCASLGVYQHLDRKDYELASYPVHSIEQLVSFPGTLDEFNDADTLNRFAASNLELIDAIDRTDVVVINGEDAAPGSLKSVLLLYIAYVAKQVFGKEVQIINHAFLNESHVADNLSTYQQIYGALDFVASLDDTNESLCKQLGGAGTLGASCLPVAINTLFPDTVRGKCSDIIAVGASTELSAKSIERMYDLLSDNDLAGTHRFRILLGSRAHMSQQDIALVGALARHNVQNLEMYWCASESDWLSQIASSAVVVSGRFHHSLAAACVGTPFVLNNEPGSAAESLLRSLAQPERHSSLAQAVKEVLPNPSRYLPTSDQIHDMTVSARASFSAL